MSAIDEKTKAEKALKDLQKVQGEERVSLKVFFYLFILFFSFPSSLCISIFAFIWFYLLTWT